MVNLTETINLKDNVISTVTRSPAITGKVVMILFISGILFIFQHFLNKVLFKSLKNEEFNRALILLVFIMMVPLILLFFSIETFLEKEFSFLIIFLLFFLLTINLIAKFLENPKIDCTFLYLIISLIILLTLFKIAKHYPSINFFKPLANWFGMN